VTTAPAPQAARPVETAGFGALPSPAPTTSSIRIESREVPPAFTRETLATTAGPPAAPAPNLVEPALSNSISAVSFKAIDVRDEPAPSFAMGGLAPVALPPSPPPPAAPAPEPASALRTNSDTVMPPRDQELVRGVLQKYADAYSRLDAAAAQAVWPSVNRSALTRAFGNLSEQSVALDSCIVDVSDVTARANCNGSSTWQPKVGGGGRKTDARRWSFDLAKGPNGWTIRDARVQNR